MYRTALTLFIQVLLVVNINCQDDVYTPKGDLVEVTYISAEWSDSMRNVYDSIWSANYPNATRIDTYGGYSTTKKFNCHGYAWHVSEDGDYVVIGIGTFNRDEAIYWEDTNHSYTIGSNQVKGGKVSYGNFSTYDHSAVIADPAIYGTGKVISKWYDKVLMLHDIDDSPYSYDTDSIKYYKLNPNMTTESNSVLCYNVERDFITDITHMTGATLDWTPSGYITYEDGEGTSTYTVKGSGNGASSVDFEISTPSGFSWSSEKEFWAGKPIITNRKVDGYNYYSGYPVCPGDHYLSVTPVGDGAGTATWTVPSGITYYVGTNTLDFTFPSSSYGLNFSARSANTCGTGSSYSFYITKKTYGCSKSFSITLYPNPASDYVTISIDDQSEEYMETKSNDGKLNNFTIKIYNSQSYLVSTLKRSGQSFEIPIQELKKGTYIVEVSDGINSCSEQLIVNNE